MPPAATEATARPTQKDACVIADHARMRCDLQSLQEWDEIAVDLKILTTRRYDLAADRTRAINRWRAQLLEYFPALERAFDYAACKGALVLLTGYRTPAALRRIGTSRLASWLTNRKVRGPQALADAAVAAAHAQHIAVVGETTAAAVVHSLARTVLALVAILALARRRLDILWALLRDQRQWTVQPPQPSGLPSPGSVWRLPAPLLALTQRIALTHVPDRGIALPHHTPPA
jgi:hypothetical protein